MRRRKFITLFGGAAATTVWPVRVRAQSSEPKRRIAILFNLAADDPEGQARLNSFLQGLRALGWIEGRNLRIDTRWGAGNAERMRSYATELVALAPDVVLARATADEDGAVSSGSQLALQAGIDSLVVVPLPGDACADVGLLHVVGNDEFDRLAKRLPAEILNRQLCRGN
jgi:hypothetical protein